MCFNTRQDLSIIGWEGLSLIWENRPNYAALRRGKKETKKQDTNNYTDPNLKWIISSIVTGWSSIVGVSCVIYLSFIFMKNHIN